jgi:hypothetical protein
MALRMRRSRKCVVLVKSDGGGVGTKLEAVFLFGVHNSPALHILLIHVYPVQPPPPSPAYFCRIHLNIMLPSTPESLRSMF